MKKKLLISLLVTIGLLVVAVTIAYLIVLFRKPALNTVNNLEKTIKKQATSTNIVNSFNAGNYDESLKLANDYLQKHPKDAQAWAAKATILANKGSVEFKENTYGQQAIEVANKALAIDPQLPEGFYARGYAHEIQNQFEQTKSDYDKALSMDKDNPTYLNQMGHLYDLMGKPEEAKKYYEQALAINPNFGKALINMGRYEMRYGSEDKAMQYFEKSLPVINNDIEKAGVYYSLGMLKLNQDKLQEGYKYMQQAVKMAPEYPQALIGRGWAGMLLMTQKDGDLEVLEKQGLTFQTAFDDVNSAIKINPNQTLGYLVLARMYLRLPFLANKSLDYYDQALSVVDNDITIMSNDRASFKKEIEAEKEGAKNVLKDVQKFENNNKQTVSYLYRLKYGIENTVNNVKNLFLVKNVLASEGGYWRGNCWIGDDEYTDVCFTMASFDYWINYLNQKGHYTYYTGTYTAYCDNGSPILFAGCGSANDNSFNQKPVNNLCINSDVVWTDEVANDGDWNWNCKDSHSGKVVGCSARRIAQCTGTLPAGAKICPGTNTGLTANTPWHKVADCAGATKCAYTKKAECGSANGGKYHLEVELKNAGLCQSGFTPSAFTEEPTEFSDDQGNFFGKWVWTCSKSGYDTSNECLATKYGQCNDAPTNVPYANLNGQNGACRFGHFNSVSVDSNGVFRWTCGTNSYTGLNTRHIGSFNSSDAGAGSVVFADNYEPVTGGSNNCQCTAQYKYYCQSAGYNCTNKCGQNVEEIYYAYKEDKHCFPNEDTRIMVTQEEYNNQPISSHGANQPTACTNKPVTCPPCGAGGGGSDTINETN